MIETTARCSIPEIFEQSGEQHFRELENEALDKAILRETPAVIALGGGALMRDENRKSVRGQVVVWLTAEPATLVDRLRGDRNRPLLYGNSLEEVIPLRLGERQSSYEETANFVVSTDHRSEEEIAREVLELSKWPILEST